MTDVIITGASRGIGRATALAVAQRPGIRLILVARDRQSLGSLADEIGRAGGQALVVPGDLSSVRGARALGDSLGSVVAPGATLVHNAGVWPSRRVLNQNGLESAFAVNCVGPLVAQQPLLASGSLSRIMVVSAGLLIKGRFDPQRTPSGEDFSSWRTYCTTKLCLALAMHDVAAQHPEVDVVVLHPGVVRTGLGDRRGVVGALLRLVKRSWEDPAVCGARLARLLARERWSEPGKARWMVEESEQAWPAVAQDEVARRALRELTAPLLAGIQPGVAISAK